MFEMFLAALPFAIDTPSTYQEQVIYDQVPEGIILQDCGHGYGLFASKSFKAGDVLYKHSYKVIGEEDQSFLLITDQGNFQLTTSMHSVGIGNGNRCLFYFDSLINHSCDANSYSLTNPEMTKNYEYFQVASKDIQVGDQITCDYNLFEYDGRDKNILDCRCQSSNCRKVIAGFKWLPLGEQLQLLSIMDVTIVRQFLTDNPETFRVDIQEIPEGIQINWDLNKPKIVSKNSYKRGDAIYETYSESTPGDQLIIIQMEGQLIVLNDLNAFSINEFIRLSNDSNVEIKCISLNHYQVIATKLIHAGDELLR